MSNGAGASCATGQLKTASASQNSEHIRLWRSLMELAQITDRVLGHEVPEDVDLPACSLSILRLLRWGGPTSRRDIAGYLVERPATVDQTLQKLEECNVFNTLIETGYVREASHTSDTWTEQLELTPKGEGIARRIIDRQRDLLWRALSYVHDPYRHLVASILEQLADGLTAEASRFDIVCAECWAYDPNECTRKNAMDRCPFIKAGRAHSEPGCQRVT